MILNVFKTDINALSLLGIFYAVFSVFLTDQWQLRHTGSSGLARVFYYDLCRMPQVCLQCRL